MFKREDKHNRGRWEGGYERGWEGAKQQMVFPSFSSPFYQLLIGVLYAGPALSTAQILSIWNGYEIYPEINIGAGVTSYSRFNFDNMYLYYSRISWSYFSMLCVQIIKSCKYSLLSESIR